MISYRSAFSPRQRGNDVELVQEMLNRPVTGTWSKSDEIAYDQVMRKKAWSVMLDANFTKDFLPKGILFI